MGGAHSLTAVVPPLFFGAFRQLQPAVENGIREILLLPQTRAQFEQQVFHLVRGDLLSKAGVNPMSPAQVEIYQAEFRGADYVASYVPR